MVARAGVQPATFALGVRQNGFSGVRRIAAIRRTSGYIYNNLKCIGQRINDAVKCTNRRPRVSHSYHTLLNLPRE